MEDYFNDLKNKDKGKSKDKKDINMTPEDEAEVYMTVMQIMEMVHGDTVNNNELIKNQSKIISELLEILAHHKHCPKCQMVYIKNRECACRP